MTPASVPPPVSSGSGRWTGLIGVGLRLRLAQRARRLQDEAYWRANARFHQLAILRALLARAENTDFGREHGFSRLLATASQGLADDALLDAFRAAVPLRDWHGFRDRIARMREGGEPDVLWPGLVKHFAQTSGTTAGDKFIPVTREMFRSNYRSSLDIFAHLMNRGVSLSRVMGGRCLFLGGSSDLKPGPHGVVTADLSGLVAPLIRWPLTEIYSPGPAIALMDDWPAKIDAMARLALQQDIRFVSGMPSWTLALMERVLQLARDQGRPAHRVWDVWPNLEVFVHGGVRYAPFRARVASAVTGSSEGDIPVRHELYPASEAFVAQQDAPDPANPERAGAEPASPSLRLQTDLGNLFEFVPLDAFGADGSPPADDNAAKACWQVEPGVRYVVVVTSCAGLFRYVLGDVVEFDDLPDGAPASAAATGTGPPRLRIVGRHRHFINAFGENLIVEHIENAVAHASAETGVLVGEFTAAPVYPGGGRRAGLELAVEILNDQGAELHTLRRFAELFDQSLKRQNVDYTTKRTSDLGMAPPVVTPLSPGAFDRWMGSVGKLGGQHKAPRCANHRDIIEGVVAMSQRSARPASQAAPGGLRSACP